MNIRRGSQNYALWRMWHPGEETPKSALSYCFFMVVFWLFLAPFLFPVGLVCDATHWIYRKTIGKFFSLPPVRIID